MTTAASYQKIFHPDPRIGFLAQARTLGEQIARGAIPPDRIVQTERLVFNNRLAMVIICGIITVVLGYIAATRLVLNASFEKMIPQSQPYIKNYLTYQKDLRGLGNAIRVVVENTDGDIFDPQYLEVLKQVNDELILTPGVDRAWVKSLWTPAVTEIAFGAVPAA